MTIIEKHFDKKPTRDEMETFLKKIMKLKGQNKMDVVYDARIDPIISNVEFMIRQSFK